MNTKICLAFGLASIFGGSAFAAPFTNGSFESGNYSFNGQGADSLQPNDTSITGWTVINAETAVISNTDSFGLTSEDGQIFLDLTGYHDSSPYGGVEQTFTTVAGQSYTLSFYIGVNDSLGDSYGPASVTATVNGVSNVFTNSSTPNTASGMNWALESETFTATSASTTLDLVGASTAAGHFIGLDNVSVVPAPEPITMGLVAAGLIAVARRRRK